ncbi:MAG: nucleotidyltransferase family protein, partial [Polyangiaceae bacterium]
MVRLREALVDPSRLVENRRTAEARHLLVSHVVARIGEALEAARCEALLAKGAALAQTVYPEPWQREMADIDLIARP